MQFIFWTCFSLMLSCLMLHNKFMFCSTWVSETSGASLASYRMMISNSKQKHVHNFQNPIPTGQNSALRKEPGADEASVLGMWDLLGTLGLCKPLLPSLISKLQQGRNSRVLRCSRWRLVWVSSLTPGFLPTSSPPYGKLTSCFPTSLCQHFHSSSTLGGKWPSLSKMSWWLLVEACQNKNRKHAIHALNREVRQLS